MFKKFVMNEDGFWVSDCEQFSWVALARKLTKIHHENNIPICYIDRIECRRLDKEQNIEDRLLCYMEFSNRITINDNVIMIFDWIFEENKGDVRKMAKEFVKTEKGFWSCGCERLTDRDLACKLVKTCNETGKSVSLYQTTVRAVNVNLKYNTLLKYICNSNYVTIDNESIKIFDNVIIEEKDDNYIDILEAYGVTLETTPEEFEVDMGEIFKMLLVIEHRLRRIENLKDNNRENIVDEDIDVKLSKLIGTKFDYDKLRDCFPPEARSSFTLCKADHDLSDYDDDDDVETYLVDSDYTEYYHIVVKDGVIIETR